MHDEIPQRSQSEADPAALSVSRRMFGRLLGAVSVGAALVASGCASFFAPRKGKEPAPVTCEPASSTDDDFDYVVVGSGAGGGPLAANLARGGFKVLVLEAGGDDQPQTYDVPVFHPFASEDPRLSWSFFPRHYSDDAQQARDSKFTREADGVLYPRAGTLGGCTAHNAMITVYGHDSDWDYIARLTGDASWRSDRMRRYFERLENCQYRPKTRRNLGRHGFHGWLTTNQANPELLVHDSQLKKVFKAAALETFSTLASPLRVIRNLLDRLDPNDARFVERSGEGVCVTPLAIRNGRRVSTRDVLLATAAACPDRLVIKTHALATRVLLDDDKRATGVEFLEGERLYRAHADPATERGTRRRVFARREVILAGGAFNTPQLLMLSGIGPREHLESHGIAVRHELPGVGRNLQDRYEVGVVLEMEKEFALLDDVGLMPESDPTGRCAWREDGVCPEGTLENDPMLAAWRATGEGVHATNGAVVSLIKRSLPERPEPDLYIFGVAGRFRGYSPGYSLDVATGKNYFTWAILKAHTENHAGYVRLRSNDPLDVPEINFKYFAEGSDTRGDDLDAVVEGVEFVRRVVARYADLVRAEEVPGPEVATKEQIREFVRDQAWGHHASCTCKMGPETDRLAVTDSRFRVHGIDGLRIVDASVFPRIPGFFIVTPIYMISEKASDVILADARAKKSASGTATMGGYR